MLCGWLLRAHLGPVPAAEVRLHAGGELAGPGSPHTPKGYVWPLALMIQALTSSDPRERIKIFRWLLKMQCGNGLMHESVNANNLSQCTRPWCAEALLWALLMHHLTMTLAAPPNVL